MLDAAPSPTLTIPTTQKSNTAKSCARESRVSASCAIIGKHAPGPSEKTMKTSGEVPLLCAVANWMTDGLEPIRTVARSLFLTHSNSF